MLSLRAKVGGADGAKLFDAARQLPVVHRRWRELERRRPPRRGSTSGRLTIDCVRERGMPARCPRALPWLEGNSGSARIRVIPPLPWRYDFDDPSTACRPSGSTPPASTSCARWTAAKVLTKKADNPFLRRARVYMGPSGLVRTTRSRSTRWRRPRRRQMGVVGVVAQRYQLALLGSHQRLELQSWQPETERTAKTSVQVAGGHLVPPQARGERPSRMARCARAARCGPGARTSPPSGLRRAHGRRSPNTAGQSGHLRRRDAHGSFLRQSGSASERIEIA